VKSKIVDMKTLLRLTSAFQKCAAITVLLVLSITSYTFAQTDKQAIASSVTHPKSTDSFNTVTPPSPDTWGKIIGTKKEVSYTTKDGSRTYKIGDKINIGLGSGERKEFQYIHFHFSKNGFAKLLNAEPAELDKKYEGGQGGEGVVADIYEVLLDPTDILKDKIYHKSPKKIVIFFRIGEDDVYDADIELALRTKGS